MIVKLKKWGNNIGLRIPQQYVKDLKLEINEELVLTIQENGLYLKKVEKKLTLDDLLEGINFDKRHEEQITNYVGKERYWEEEE